jgi:protein-disulfide isomerase
MRMLFLLLLFAMTSPALAPQCVTADEPGEAWILHTYEVRFRFEGKISVTQVQASDAGQAKKLVQAQFGPKVTVLSTKRLK